VNWDWLQRNGDLLAEQSIQHVRITFIALAIGIAVAFPVALVGYRWRRSYPPILALTQVLYTIPSLALFVLLLTIVGLNEWPVIIGLAIYSLVILVRNVVEGLRAVPESVRDAATAMGYGDTRRLLTVELPLAVPAIFAGLRVASVSTISMVSVGALIGTGGLGQLFIEGFQIDNPIEIWAGIVLTVVLAFIVDLALVGSQRILTPWVKARAVLR
jgi:osmoprotectant transport system permease protein